MLCRISLMNQQESISTVTLFPKPSCHHSEEDQREEDQRKPYHQDASKWYAVGKTCKWYAVGCRHFRSFPRFLWLWFLQIMRDKHTIASSPRSYRHSRMCIDFMTRSLVLWQLSPGNSVTPRKYGQLRHARCFVPASRKQWLLFVCLSE